MSKAAPLSDSNYLFVSMENREFSPIFVSYYGWHKCSSTQTNYFSFKRCYTLHIVLKGKGYYSHNAVRHELKEGDFFLINPAETVSYYPDKKEPWEYIWFGLTGDGVKQFFKELALTETLVGTLKSLDGIVALFNRLQDEKSRKSLSSFGYYGIFMAIFDEMTRQKIFPAHYSNEENSDFIQRALDYIAEHYATDISISKMSKALFVERTTLFKGFKKKFNVSPQQYIISYRLRIAQQHICETLLPLTVIAEKCGFPNYSHFSRSFTAHFGYSPSKMRKSTNFGGVPNVSLPNDFDSITKKTPTPPPNIRRNKRQDG